MAGRSSSVIGAVKPIAFPSRPPVRIRLANVIGVWHSAEYVACGAALADETVEVVCEPDGWMVSQYLVQNN